MLAHVRANLLLLGLTLLIGAVLYPLTILLLGQGLFPDQAEGSLLKDKDGTVIGSRLLAQDFQKPQYFQPRPSSGGYNAADSGGTNWAASNPRLRDRVARQLGPVVKDHSGKPIGPEVEEWLRTKGDPLTFWLKKNPKLAEAWLSDNKDPIEAWLKEQATDEDFFKAFARKEPGAFPDVQDKKIVVVRKGEVIQGAFFDLWLREHPERAGELNRVPADQVMASGSGLDPHITLKNARSQVPRVIDAWIKEGKVDRDQVNRVVENLLSTRAFKPLLSDEALVNVLELNHFLQQELEKR